MHKKRQFLRPNNNVDSNIFPHLATALDPQWKDLKVNNKSGREGVLAQGESRDGLSDRGEGGKVDAPKPKRRLLDINESDNECD